MEVTLRKTSQFFSDLTSIIDYIAADNPDAAVRFLDAVEESLEMLRRMPELGTRIPSKDKYANRNARSLESI